ncbi:MAG: 50S ribosomal protein L11 methyltransferase [Alphaproteobacteria bacterium]|nr:50S ribosomal protein L11 methyltransferase [Alphaproteobacteria bacterium]
MSNNAGSCKIVKFCPVAETDEKLQEFADEFFDVVTLDYNDDGMICLTGYLPADAEEKSLDTAAQNANIILPEHQWDTLSSDDWLTENVIKFAPVDTEDFVVYGIHEHQVDLHGKIGVKVYAATAFGSEHQTTKSCLNAISDINRLNPDVKNVLDVGTGSGVLAIAAAKLWKNAKITAVDIDKESVIVAKQNAEDNNVSVAVDLSDGYSADLVKNNAPYDVIFANILARPLIAMASDMAKNLVKGGYAVISGFVDDQTDWVVGEHKKHGLELKKIYYQDNWRAALLEKK